MARVCKTCTRPEVNEINQMLVDGVPLTKIVAKFKGSSLGGIQRHKEVCIRDLFAEVREKKRVGLLASVDEVKQEIAEVRATFPDNGNVRLGLIGKMLDAIEKEAKLTGAYIKDATNPADALTQVKQFVAEAAKHGMPEQVAYEKAYKLWPEAKQQVH